MKETGIIRRIDDLGRVVVPKEIRRTMGIREGDPLEIFLDKDGVCFKKYDYAKTLNEILSDFNNAIDEGNFDREKISEIRKCVSALRDLI